MKNNYNSAIYSSFASYYDRLISDVDYDKWYAFIKKELDRASVPSGAQIIDLACGSGAFSGRLAKDGYDAIGVDISQEMLSLAYAKAEKENILGSVMYIRQDMRTLDLNDCAGGAICCLDGLNYLKSTKDLKAALTRLRLFLVPGAPFIFDVNTKYKFENILANNTFVYEYDGLFCTWENDYNKKSGRCIFRLTFFAEDENGLWHREEEFQEEKAFSDRTIIKALEESGFGNISVYSDTDLSPITDTDERRYFVCFAE